jgi:hypothetical protein
MSIITTKQEFLSLLDSTILKTQGRLKKTPSLSLYDSILAQLSFLKKTFVAEKRLLTKDEISRLTFGLIAVRNFTNEDPYANALCSIYGGATKFEEFD